jgi:hypothetical protein
LGILITVKNVDGIKRLTLEKEVKTSPLSPLSPPKTSKAAQDNDSTDGDKGGDTFPDGDKGGDTFPDGDKGGDKKMVIPTLETD